MEGSSGDPSRRRRLADLYGAEPEEGELVPGAGYHSDADTEEYYNTHRDYSSDSDETVSDSVQPANYGGASATSSAAGNNYGSASTSSAAAYHNGGGGGLASSAPAAPLLSCPFCGKEFRNHKAVCGHMKVHREEQGIGKGKRIKRISNVPVVGAWGRAGKRGCSGSKGRAASPDAEPDQSNESMAIVVAEAEIVLNPMPLAFAPPSLPPVPTETAAPNLSSVPTASAASNPSIAPTASATPIPSPAASATVANDSVESSSVQPTHTEAMETVDAGASAPANPPTDTVVHLHAAPPPPPAAAGGQAPPVDEPPVAPQPGGRQDPNGYTCKKCNMWFRTHQGLGGHMVGHKNRDLAAALQQDGAVPSHRSAKPAKAHVCRVCGAEFPGGLQLGGHMRKHWTGAPFNKKPRRLPPAGAVSAGAADLTLALSVKADEASLAPAPAAAGRVLLFGIDIGAGVKTPAAQEGTSATEAPASTGGEQ